MVSDSRIVELRFREICPLENIQDMKRSELKKATHVAFEIIGFHPSNFDEAFDEVYKITESTVLCDFVYDVWRVAK